MAVYFGGSRHLAQCSINTSLVSSVVAAVVASGQGVHVGCQFGADQTVVQSCNPLSLSVFAVASCNYAPAHVMQALVNGAVVQFSAGGGEAVNIKARYLLRSIAAFQGCDQAIFFQPGNGSLAVARECVRSGLPVFAFGAQPARVPSVSGQWVASSFMGFQCWQWSPKQQQLF